MNAVVSNLTCSRAPSAFHDVNSALCRYSSNCGKDHTLPVQIVCEVVHVLKRHQLDGVGAHFIAHSFGAHPV